MVIYMFVRTVSAVRGAAVACVFRVLGCTAIALEMNAFMNRMCSKSVFTLDERSRDRLTREENTEMNGSEK